MSAGSISSDPHERARARMVELEHNRRQKQERTPFGVHKEEKRWLEHVDPEVSDTDFEAYNKKPYSKLTVLPSDILLRYDDDERDARSAVCPGTNEALDQSSVATAWGVVLITPSPHRVASSVREIRP